MAATAAENRSKTYDMVYIGVFAVIIAICSWISIPTTVPFTLQTFAVFSALLMWGMEKWFGRKKNWVLVLQMIMGLVVCYAIGTVWFMVVYGGSSGAIGVGTVLGMCVIPFIIPDLIKIAFAFVLSKRVASIIRM